MSLPREKNARFSFVLDLVNDGSFFLCVVGISTRDMGGSVFFLVCMYVGVSVSSSSNTNQVSYSSKLLGVFLRENATHTIVVFLL